MPHYPVYLDLQDRSCVVVGGCGLAEEKARALLAAGARVTLISPDLTPGLADLAVEGRIDVVARRFRQGDLRKAFLAVVTVSEPAVVEAVWRESRERNVLVNTVDDLPHCDFIAPAVVRKGDLSVAISTDGKAPALAVRLRQRLEAELGEEHARFLELAGSVRAPLARLLPDLAARRDVWYRLIDSDVLHLLRRGEEAAAVARFEEILGVRPESSAA
ncbi:MAG TPA: bifunctional precorrin-2 dehydrogenase/sirohydrochlorin ferrochelatase [Thermoanaerobaculia bacterium]|jgi:siroheme synthase-like protein|nr:bifunctional precorrin-2 dehydrogenase/sirohydrochlorin ferrochelatase [Thermoanaerobaculia bacterium]